MSETTLASSVLQSLAERANAAAGRVEEHAKNAVLTAVEAGEILLEAKQLVPHGQWLAWLGKHFDYGQQYASRYMTIASNYARVRNLKEASSIREALRMIAEDPETPKRERKPSVEVVEKPIEVEAKPLPEKTQGETVTNAVVREESRKAPAHRPPEKFAEVSPSYEDEDEAAAVPMRLESGFDDVEATERIRSFIHKEMARWPSSRHQEAIQVFHLYLGGFENE